MSSPQPFRHRLHTLAAMRESSVERRGQTAVQLQSRLLTATAFVRPLLRLTLTWRCWVKWTNVRSSSTAERDQKRGPAQSGLALPPFRLYLISVLVAPSPFNRHLTTTTTKTQAVSGTDGPCLELDFESELRVRLEERA